MRQFKHIPTNIIYKLDTLDTHLYPLTGGDKLPLLLTQNSKDWEEIKEKDYVIIAFRTTLNKLIYTLREDGKYSQDNNVGFAFGEDVLLTQGYEILTVKRLSDGGIFTIGDKIAFANTSGELIKIDLQETMSSHVRLFFKDGRYLTMDWVNKPKPPLFTTTDGVDVYRCDPVYIVSLENAKQYIKDHTKVKLFTTEDGVDIYEYDLFYRVNPDVWKITEEKAFEKRTPELVKQYSWFKFFSTRAMAEEYILMNKPLLSVKEVFQHLNLGNLNSLKQYAKSKLK